jgi:hypothetical protein
MAERLSTRSIVQFLLLVVAVLFCLFLLVDRLMHAHPHVSPNVNDGGNSHLMQAPDAPARRTAATTEPRLIRR